MAIKKVSRDKKAHSDSVAAAPDLEEKRKAFQAAVSHTKKTASSSKKSKSQPKHHSARKRTLIIAVGALLAVCGSVVVAYASYFWYQTPDKVVSDALTNAIAARSVSYQAEVNSPTASLASIDGKYMDGLGEVTATIHTTYPGKLSTLQASALTTDRQLYVKLSQASDLVRQVVPVEQKKIVDTLMPTVEDRINDKWVNIASNDIPLFQAVTSTSKCTVDAVRLLNVSQPGRNALGQLYLQHPFFTIKETKVEQNFGTYQLTINKTGFDDFLDALATSDTSVPFSRCSDEIKALKNSDIDTSVIELIINKSNRTITQLSVNTPGESALAIMIVPTFDQSVTIQEPTNATRFQEIKAPFYELYARTQAN